MRRTVSIALAFVGLLVGAGFATGAEVIQYFISFGWKGIWGVVLAGAVFAVAGAVILALGSFFMADEHNYVFRNVSHPVASRLLDYSVTITLFAVGFVMLAGAGASLGQYFGWPSWVGSALMTVLVMATGLLDVEKVSSIISGLTPLIIVAVVIAFGWTMLHLPADTSHLNALAQEAESPVSPWWLSALNYNGLALILGVSMCLVIGGNHSNPRAAYRGGLAGGVLYTILLLMAAIVMLFNIDTVGQDDVPMLTLFGSMHPVLAFIMVWVIFGMIYNTCIGMFYALGRRLSAGSPARFPKVFLPVTFVGFLISFVGFDSLMTYVYPVLGYIGLAMVVYLLYWWVKHRSTIVREARVRSRATELIYAREHPEEDFTPGDARELEELAEASVMADDALHQTLHAEVAVDLHADDTVDYEATAAPETLDYAESDPAERAAVEPAELMETAAETRTDTRDQLELPLTDSDPDTAKDSRG